MARPERNTVDYFPFYCDEGQKMYVIEETYGNDGFATFIKILRELAKAEYHYLDLSKPQALMFLSAKCKVSQERLKMIIDDLTKLGKFNEVLWNENNIIWCQDFIESIEDAYKKRNNKCMTLEGLFLLLEGLGVRKHTSKRQKGYVKPQRKEKEIKEKESKLKLEPFSDTFLPHWRIWLEFKKTQFKFEYKTLTSEQIAFNGLVKLANNNEQTAKEIIEQSIGNGWSGFYELKTSNEKQEPKKMTPEEFMKYANSQFKG